MPLPPSESIARARAQLGTYDIDRKGMCLKVSRSWPQVSALYSDASTGWRNTDYRHPGDKNAPVGAMLWWTGGPDGFGHVAISDGGGFCISTDWKDGYQAGYLNRAHVDEITTRWGLPFQGWSEDINEKRIWFPPTIPLIPPPPPSKEDDMRSPTAHGFGEGKAVMFGIAKDRSIYVTVAPDGENFTSAMQLKKEEDNQPGVLHYFLSDRADYLGGGRFQAYAAVESNGIVSVWSPRINVNTGKGGIRRLPGDWSVV